MKNIFKSALLAACMLMASVGAQAGLVQDGAATTQIDLTAPQVAKIQRPTGTNHAFVTFTDGTSTTLTGGWIYVTGNAKFFQSFDGSQGAGNTATSGLDAGYDAVAVVKNNIKWQNPVSATKCATYYTGGGNSVALCTTGYLDAITSRTSPYGQGAW